jgi:hypothetical protein
MMGKVFPAFIKAKYQERFLKAYRGARENGRGLWG